jgi:ribosomal protein S18 acetylase RimI-like enzyme
MLPLLHQQIEECGFNALPVMQSQLYDGWTIRLSGGGPRRANSINVMAPSTLPLSEKLAHSMPLFYQNGISPTFRLTGHEFNRELDSFLENEGYFAGIFDVATLSASRRCGYARSLVLGLLHQAKEAGADKVYLQVMADNAAAISLYKSIGFHQIYAYHYRVKFDVFEEGASDTSKLQSLFD